MPDIVTLTINPAIDIFVNVGRVEPTRKLRSGAAVLMPGTGLCQPEDVRRLLPKVKIREIEAVI